MANRMLGFLNAGIEQDKKNRELEQRGSSSSSVPASIGSKTSVFKLKNDNWYDGDTPTSARATARMYALSYDQPIKWDNAYAEMQTARQTRGNVFYDPTSYASSSYMKTLNSYGIDTSSIDDNFWKQYEPIMHGVDRTNEGAVKSPTKKSSQQDAIAYALQGLWQDDQNTKKAEAEKSSLYDDVAYYAGRGLTDKEIKERIGADFDKKYPTLSKISGMGAYDKDLEYTRALNFNKDTVDGMIWAARNGDTSGDFDGAAVRYHLGQGKSQPRDASAVARRDPTSSEFNPYVDGATDDTVRRAFGTDVITKDVLEANRSMLGDPNKAKVWQTAYTQAAATEAAKTELSQLQSYMERPSFASGAEKAMRTAIEEGRDPYEAAVAYVDSVVAEQGLTHLKNMDAKRREGSVYALTDTVNYRAEDIARSLYDNMQQAESAARTPKEVVETATQPQKNVLQQVGDFFGGLFGGEKPAPTESEQPVIVEGEQYGPELPPPMMEVPDASYLTSKPAPGLLGVGREQPVIVEGEQYGPELPPVVGEDETWRLNERTFSGVQHTTDQVRSAMNDMFFGTPTEEDLQTTFDMVSQDNPANIRLAFDAFDPGGIGTGSYNALATTYGSVAAEMLATVADSKSAAYEVAAFTKLYTYSQMAYEDGADSMAEWMKDHPEAEADLQSIQDSIQAQKAYKASQDAAAANEARRIKADTAMNALKKVAAGDQNFTPDEVNMLQQVTNFTDEDEKAYWAEYDADPVGYLSQVEDDIWNQIGVVAQSEGNTSAMYSDVYAVAEQMIQQDWKMAKAAGMTLEELYEQFPDLKKSPEALVAAAQRQNEARWNYDNLDEGQKQGIDSFYAMGLGAVQGWRGVLEGNVGFAIDATRADDNSLTSFNHGYYVSTYGYGAARSMYERDVLSYINSIEDDAIREEKRALYDQAKASGTDIFSVPFNVDIATLENAYNGIAKDIEETDRFVFENASDTEKFIYSTARGVTQALTQFTEQLALTAAGTAVGMPGAGLAASAATYLPSSTHENFGKLNQYLSTGSSFVGAMLLGCVDVLMENEMVQDWYMPGADNWGKAVRGWFTKQGAKNGAAAVGSSFNKNIAKAAELVVDAFAEGVQENAQNLAAGIGIGAMTGDWSDLAEAVQPDNVGDTLLQSMFAAMFMKGEARMLFGASPDIDLDTLVTNKTPVTMDAMMALDAEEAASQLTPVSSRLGDNLLNERRAERIADEESYSGEDDVNATLNWYASEGRAEEEARNARAARAADQAAAEDASGTEAMLAEAGRAYAQRAAEEQVQDQSVQEEKQPAVAEQPVAEEKPAEAPVAEQPVVEEKPVEAPAVEQPVAEEKPVEAPVVEQPDTNAEAIAKAEAKAQKAQEQLDDYTKWLNSFKKHFGAIKKARTTGAQEFSQERYNSYIKQGKLLAIAINDLSTDRESNKAALADKYIRMGQEAAAAYMARFDGSMADAGKRTVQLENEMDRLMDEYKDKAVTREATRKVNAENASVEQQKAVGMAMWAQQIKEAAGNPARIQEIKQEAIGTRMAEEEHAGSLQTKEVKAAIKSLAAAKKAVQQKEEALDAAKKVQENARGRFRTADKSRATNPARADKAAEDLAKAKEATAKAKAALDAANAKVDSVRDDLRAKENAAREALYAKISNEVNLALDNYMAGATQMVAETEKKAAEEKKPKEPPKGPKKSKAMATAEKEVETARARYDELNNFSKDLLAAENELESLGRVKNRSEKQQARYDELSAKLDEMYARQEELEKDGDTIDDLIYDAEMDLSDAKDRLASVKAREKNKASALVRGPRQQRQRGNTNGKARRSPLEIAQRLASDIGLGEYFTTKNMEGVSKTTDGFYRAHSDYATARPGSQNDPDTLMHEISHAISQRTGMTGDENMIAVMKEHSDLDLDSYDPEELPGEAFAEFGKTFIESRDMAVALYGQAKVNEYEMALRKAGLLKAVQKAQAETTAYLNASADAKIGAHMTNFKGGTAKKTGITTAVKDFFRKGVIRSVRDVYSARRLDDIAAENGYDGLRLEQRLRLAKFSDRAALNIVTGELTDASGMPVRESMAEAINLSTEEELNSLARYALAKHALKREQTGQTVFGSTISQQELQDLVDNAPQDIKEAHARLMSWWGDFMHTWMVDTGLISQEEYDFLREKWPDYVPTLRDLKDGNSVRGGNSEFKMHAITEHGSDLNVINPLVSMQHIIGQTVAAARRNEAMRTLYDYMTEVGDMGEFARVVPGDMVANTISMDELLDELTPDLAAAGASADTIVNLRGLLSGDMYTQYRRSRSSSQENVIGFTDREGKHHLIEVNDIDLFNSILGGKNMRQSGAVLSGIAHLTRTMSMLTTGNNPLFTGKNFIRDFQHSVNHGSWAANYATGLVKWVGALADVVTEKGLYKEYTALGGGGYTRPGMPNTKKAGKEAVNNLNSGKMKKLTEGIEKLIKFEYVNEWVEQTSRYAEFKYGKHDLTTEQGRIEAFLAAQDATVDFAQSGNSGLASEMGKLIPFYNAALQGAWQNVDTFSKAERGRLAPRMAKTLVNNMLLGALAYAFTQRFGSDDDKKWYDRLAQDIRLDNFVIPLGGDSERQYLRLPLAQSPYAKMAYAFGNLAMQLGNDDPISLDIARAVDHVLSPTNILSTDTIFEPIVGLLKNENYYGNTLVSTRLQKLPETQQYNDSTPEFFTGASRFLKWATSFGHPEDPDKGVSISPIALQYLFQQYTGVVGQVAIPMMSGDKYNGYKPNLMQSLWETIRNSFTVDPAYSNDITDAYYDNVDMLSQITQGAKDQTYSDLLSTNLTDAQADEAVREAKRLTSKGGELYAISKEISELYGDMSANTESEAMTRHEKAMANNALMRQIVELEMEANGIVWAYQREYMEGSSMLEYIMHGGHAAQPAK